MTLIYCDEAGNSGENLLDKNQPFFILASNDFTSSEAKQLLEHVRSPQGGEPKFKTLKKTNEGVSRLSRFFSDPRLNKHRVAANVFHKRFMVVTKMVDLIVETLAHQLGKDIYRGGMNIGMSNMLYYCLPAFCGKEATDQFLASFVDLMRNRSESHVTAYFESGKNLLENCSDDNFKETLFWFVEPKFFEHWFKGIYDLALDPAIPALFQHINTWGIRKENRFRVIHDRSKPILASEKDFHDMMAMSEEQSKMVGYDRRKFAFPLRAESLEQGDSLEHPQLQIADICAGAINHYLKSRENNPPDDLTKMIETMDCFSWIIGGVMPSTDVTPEELGTVPDDGANPVDPVVDHLYRRRNTNA